jgi:NAD(P)-dependent dehydrogenase (short-subunit alcohol dehydrogenase family)
LREAPSAIRLTPLGWERPDRKGRGKSPYCASKFALEGLTDALRLELASSNVRVSLIEPGSIDTDIWRKYETYTDWLTGVLPESAQALYGDAIQAAREAARRRAESGIPPQAVAGVVARALTAKRPKTRYVVGWDAKLGVALGRFVPDRLLDEAILRYMKLPRAS